MKTTFQFTEATTELKNFVPVEGTWDISADPSEDWDEYQAAQEIAAGVEKQFGFPVEIQMFTSSGNKITSECPDRGNFLATRK